ncbi:MAG: citrulline utilization hydrolase CtlX [Flavobacteriales bacterium]
MKQTTRNVLMVRPAAFGFNEQTASNNVFQQALEASPDDVQAMALSEFERAVSMLREKGINVYVLNDSAVPPKPDAIFPNNWISFGHNGLVTLFPMHAPNRREETHLPWESLIRKQFVIRNIKDLRNEALNNRFLEGTGSIIFDHLSKVAYANKSVRTNEELFIAYCRFIGYEPILFDALNEAGLPYYHTNVILSIGSTFAVLCSDSMVNKHQKSLVIERLIHSGRELIEVSFDQVNQFAANILQLQSGEGESLIALSQLAYDAFLPEQRSVLKKHGEVIVAPIPTIEKVGGGSFRCMIAEIFLSDKQ